MFTKQESRVRAMGTEVAVTAHTAQKEHLGGACLAVLPSTSAAAVS